MPHQKLPADFNYRFAEVIEKQYQRYEPYRKLCAMENRQLEDLKAMARAGDLQSIPTIPADWFKRGRSKGLFKQLSHIQEGGCWLVSSSTSGDSSYTWRTPADKKQIVDSFAQAYRKLPQAKAVAFSPTAEFLRKIGQRFAIDQHPVEFYAAVPADTAAQVFNNMDSLAKLNLARTIWVMLKTRGKGRPVLDLQKAVLVSAIQEAEQNHSPLIFSASVLMLYPALRGLDRTYKLGKNAYFLTGAGGWDGKKATMQGDRIVKTVYAEQMATRFGVSPDDYEAQFWDIYGTTENGKAQIGHYSREQGDFLFEVGGDVKLYVINPINGQPVKAGEQGYPRFVSPYGVEGFAGASVQQSDIVKVVSLYDDGAVHQFTGISRAMGDEGVGGLGCAFELVEGVNL
jgi:hypothetical protein